MTSAHTGRVRPLSNHPGVPALPERPIKGSLSFYGRVNSVGSETLFTLLPQENFPVGSRRIYELIKLLFRRAHFFTLVSSGELGRPSLSSHPPLPFGVCTALHPSRDRAKWSCRPATRGSPQAGGGPHCPLPAAHRVPHLPTLLCAGGQRSQPRCALQPPAHPPPPPPGSPQQPGLSYAPLLNQEGQ